MQQLLPHCLKLFYIFVFRMFSCQKNTLNNATYTLIYNPPLAIYQSRVQQWHVYKFFFSVFLSCYDCIYGTIWRNLWNHTELTNYKLQITKNTNTNTARPDLVVKTVAAEAEQQFTSKHARRMIIQSYWPHIIFSSIHITHTYTHTINSIDQQRNCIIFKKIEKNGGRDAVYSKQVDGIHIVNIFTIIIIMIMNCLILFFFFLFLSDSLNLIVLIIIIFIIIFAVNANADADAICIVCSVSFFVLRFVSFLIFH